MAIRDIVPRIWKGRERMPAQRGEVDPFHALQYEMNRLFDDFWSDVGLAPRSGLPDQDAAWSAFSPRVDVSEDDKEIKLTAELPGMDEKDVVVEVDDAAITIRGEKKDEKEEKGKNWYRREQSYGSFHRIVPLPASVDGAHAKAKFKKGVLTITAPRRAELHEGRKPIAIETE